MRQPGEALGAIVWRQHSGCPADTTKRERGYGSKTTGYHIKKSQEAFGVAGEAAQKEDLLAPGIEEAGAADRWIRPKSTLQIVKMSEGDDGFHLGMLNKEEGKSGNRRRGLDTPGLVAVLLDRESF